MLRTVRLYGTLAIDAGVDSVNLDVNNSAMLFRGLQNLIPGFKRIAARYREMLVVGTKANAEQTEVVKASSVLEPFKDCDTIHVMPSTEGDISEAAYALAEYIGSSLIVAYAIIIVAAVAIEFGIAKLTQSMAPKPTTSKSDASFIFSGPENTTTQGGAVPIIYGTCLVGSTIIASNILTVDVPVGTVANTYIPGGGFRGGGR